MRAPSALILAAVALVPWQRVESWRQFRSWSEAEWCDQTEAPSWPYAYSKDGSTAAAEAKGRTASNLQNMGHVCALRGVRSKCHRCETIACGTTLDSNCSYQVQGTDWPDLPVNTPTVSDTPFAVGPGVKHRNDFGVAARVCVLLSGGSCIVPDASVTDYTSCAVRCWGASSGGPPTPTSYGWTYSAGSGLPQGRVTTLAGMAGVSGFKDGPGASAQFRKPQGLATDRAGNTYVADTDNHAVRVITSAGMVGTVAGSGVAGYADGLGKAALLSSPVDVAAYERCLAGGGGDLGPVMPDGKAPDGTACASYETILVVADTGNHRVRKIRSVALWSATGGSAAVVTTLAGGGNTTGALDDLESQPHGLADGQGLFARFDTPMGVAADNAGNVFVADTRNHAIRWIDPAGVVVTLAGTVEPQRKPLPGCAYPCLRGVPGYMDGLVNASRFSSPVSVALGPGAAPYTLLVSDGHRVRVVSRSGGGAGLDWGDVQALGGSSSALWAHPWELGNLSHVYTLSGQLVDGEADGDGRAARFDQPRGIAVTLDGRVYVADSARCKLRRVSVGASVARPLTCGVRLTDIVRPSGCTSYDPPTDAIDRLPSPWEAHVHYRANVSSKLVYAATTHAGRLIQQCQGTPPPDVGLFANGVTVGPTKGTKSDVLVVDEDTDSGTQMLLYCPPGCAADALSKVYGGNDGGGSFFYADASTVCPAAVHAGAVPNSLGGHVTLTLHKGFGADASKWRQGWDAGSTLAYIVGATANGVTSLTADKSALGGPVTRTFSVAPYAHPLNSTVTHTIAGAPPAPLGGSCGYADGQPPGSARFHGPSGLAVFKGWASVSDTRPVAVADSFNHVVRAVTAVCTQICENGGVCTGPDTCTCGAGWSGADCTTPICATPCGARKLCTGPDTCTCVPGYEGPSCTTATCVQKCEHGSVCGAPDTCTCLPGWFDANCTTPVCSMTCGNGGNCTAPEKCTCPFMWSGADCRTPVCHQPCLNGGTCTAPDTCTCAPSWSGHDCSKPVCHQGFFRADPYPTGFASSTWRQPEWTQFTPCSYGEWCGATSEFECLQLQRRRTHRTLPLNRNYTGKGPGGPEDMFYGPPDTDGGPGDVCIPLEVGTGLLTPYRVEKEDGAYTAYARVTASTPYGWGPVNGYHPWSAPSAATSDRQVVLTSYSTVAQGVYVCANGGNCTAPDTCTCAPGWVGFDCRIPVCGQGYYYPDRLDGRFPGGQGTYWGSPRTLTIWESPDTPNAKFASYVHDHPNFHSIEEDMVIIPSGYEPTHQFRAGPGSLLPPEFTTWEGWRLPGIWERTTSGVAWRQGNFASTYNRTCPGDGRKQVDLRPGKPPSTAVDDTLAAFQPRIVYTNAAVTASGRWNEVGGECVDVVVLGCFNSGQCVAPNTCKCAPGWEGSDCSLPVCQFAVRTVPPSEVPVTPAPPLPDGLQTIKVTLLRGGNGTNVGTPEGEPSLPGDTYVGWRTCANRGNCTRPDTCTCEKGWSGLDCKTPMCAQECANGGRCVAPDTCDCFQSPTAFIDKRGVPLFQKPNGEPQSSGWTGYDCNTPVCTQAVSWVSIDGTGSNGVTLLPQSNNPLRNDGTVFQVGCPAGGPYIPVDTRTRVSLKLCSNDAWWQGEYEESWSNGDVDEGGGAVNPSLRSKGRNVRINHPNYVKPPVQGTPWLQGEAVLGEGMYACANLGACTAPDTCTCPDGWSGFDCAVPQCAYPTMYRELVLGCAHGGVCFGVNECECPTTLSLLPEQHVYDGLPTDSITGWAASDCSMAICAQGFFDPDCRDVSPGPGGVSHMAEGCYRCPNGGNCTGPDLCTCPDLWTGYDCKTPVCVQHATQETIFALDTLDDAVIEAFEQDPCGTNDLVEVAGELLGKGNCSRPNTCTCLCIKRGLKDADGALDESPWRDGLNRPLAPGFVFGSYECLDGFEGNLNPDGTFSSCHLRIRVPTTLERYSLLILLVGVGVAGSAVPVVIIFRRLARRRMLAVKAERRRARREDEATEKDEKAKEAEKSKSSKKHK